jgi:hypothetical protein
MNLGLLMSNDASGLLIEMTKLSAIATAKYEAKITAIVFRVITHPHLSKYSVARQKPVEDA